MSEGVNLSGRHFLSMLDFSREEILGVLEKARELKRVYGTSTRGAHTGADPPVSPLGKGGGAAQAEGDGLGTTPLNPPLARGEATLPHQHQASPVPNQDLPPQNITLPLQNKTLAMIFQKPSLRTRVSFETGMTRLGGHAIYLAPTDISIGKRETTEDIALVLSRYADAIMARVFGHDIVVELARHATVPVINGLSDYEHPCQILADFLTVLERKGRLDGIRGCYIGDGNNVCHSLMLGAARVGMHLTAITPKGFEPKPDVLKMAVQEAAKTGAKIAVSNDLNAVKGADMVYTDVWASMGQESEAAAREQVFRDYRIDANTMKLADPNAIILHCLPAHYGDEIDYQTSRLPNSAIFDQAENRMHAQNGLLVHLIG